MRPRVELTRWGDRRGATIARITVGWDTTGVPTHTPGPTLSNRVPPSTERESRLILNCWQI